MDRGRYVLCSRKGLGWARRPGSARSPGGARRDGSSRRFGAFTFALLIGLLHAASAWCAEPPTQEQLVLFVHGESAASDKVDGGGAIDVVKSAAEAAGLTLKVVDVQHGAPADVTSTPTLAHQCEFGRVFFVGDARDRALVERFLRTVRQRTPEPATRRLSNVLVGAFERMGVVVIVEGAPEPSFAIAPVAVPAPADAAPPSANLPIGGNESTKAASVALARPASGWDPFTHRTLRRELAAEAVAKLSRLRKADSHALNACDALYEVDFAWTESPGKPVRLTATLYSHVDWFAPVITVEKSAANRAESIAAAMAELEPAIFEHLERVLPGTSARRAIRSSTPVKTWGELGAALPKDLQQRVSWVPRGWGARKREAGDPPAVRFQFPKPVDCYRGELPMVTGLLSIGELLESTQARFNAKVEHVTLYEAALDESVRYTGEFLQGRAHPVSSFRVRWISSPEPKLDWARPTPVHLFGEFELKGVTIPLRVRATLEPTLGSDDKPDLRLEAGFTLDRLREVFRIAGPGGEDEPSGNRIALRVQLGLQSASVRDIH